MNSTKITFTVAAAIIGIGVLSYFLYQYNYNETKDVTYLIMPDYMLAYAQLFDPKQYVLNETLLNETFAELVKNPPPPDPYQIKFNQVEEARKALPFMRAPSPVQFEVDEDITLHKVPLTMPGQIAINVIAGSGDRDILKSHSDFTPLNWSGSVLYDGGTIQKSIGGHGWDRFLMDCPPGTPWGVSVQKDSEYGYLELSYAGKEVYANSTMIEWPASDVEPYGDSEEVYEPYGMITISDICPG